MSLLQKLMCSLVLITGCMGAAFAQQIPVRWDEITASQWPQALKQSDSTCILAFGILEKHGMHDPLGTDLIQAREWAARAAKREYAVVFPDYFYGQINEARHEPGTFALPGRVVWDLLEATCEEIGRNGFKKIIIVNGHGGNPNLLYYFCQAQLEKRRSYAVFFYNPAPDAAFRKKVAAMRQSDASYDFHAGETETSTLLYLRPDLVHLEKADDESGKPLHRLHLPNAYTAIWWYADFPNHYAGDGAKATRAFGELVTEHYVTELAGTIKAIKEDKQTLALQKEYFDRVLK